MGWLFLYAHPSFGKFYPSFGKIHPSFGKLHPKFWEIYPSFGEFPQVLGSYLKHFPSFGWRLLIVRDYSPKLGKYLCRQTLAADDRFFPILVSRATAYE